MAEKYSVSFDGSMILDSKNDKESRKIFGPDWNDYHKQHCGLRTWHNSSTLDSAVYFNLYSCDGCGLSFCNICNSEIIDNPKLVVRGNSKHSGAHTKTNGVAKSVSKSLIISNGRNKPVLHYIEARMGMWTFDDPNVKEFVESRCEGLTLNLYAGKNRLEGVNEIRVDRLPDFKPDYWMEESEFLRKNELRFQTGVWDPPWKGRKSKLYDSKEDTHIGKYTKWKDLIAEQIQVGGKIIGVGLGLSNFGWKRGFVIEEALICNSFGEYSIWAVSVERKIK